MVDTRELRPGGLRSLYLDPVADAEPQRGIVYPVSHPGGLKGGTD
jgi:hypothetical protein